MENNIFEKKIDQKNVVPIGKQEKPFEAYDVIITVPVLNVRAKADAESMVISAVVEGNKVTIVHEKDGWGKLKNQAGWIMLKFTNKVS